MQSLWLKLWKISGQAIDHKVGFINICILNRQLILISCLFFYFEQETRYKYNPNLLT